MEIKTLHSPPPIEKAERPKPPAQKPDTDNLSREDTIEQARRDSRRETLEEIREKCLDAAGSAHTDTRRFIRADIDWQLLQLDKLEE